MKRNTVFFNTEFTIIRSIVYNRAIRYKRKNFFKVVVHVIIIDQCNQTARFDEIQVTLYSCHCDVRVPWIDGYL